MNEILQFTIEDHGTIVLLYPHTDWASEWVQEHLYSEDGDGPQWWGGAVVIDHRMAPAIIEAIIADDANAQHSVKA